MSIRRSRRNLIKILIDTLYIQLGDIEYSLWRESHGQSDLGEAYPWDIVSKTYIKLEKWEK